MKNKKEINYMNDSMDSYPKKYLNGGDIKNQPFTGIKKFELDVFKDLPGDSTK